MKNRILSLVVIGVLFSVSTVFAQERTREGISKDKREYRAMMMKKHAHKKHAYEKFFTEEQQEKIKVIRLETAKKVKPFKNELRELTAHQKTLTTADKADLKAINKNIDEISEKRAELAKIMAAQHQKVRSLLSEEQLIKFDNRKGKRGYGLGNSEFRNNRGGRGERG